MKPININKIQKDIQTRHCAFVVVDCVLNKKQDLDRVFDQTVSQYSDFDRRDIAFVRDMVMRFLRQLGQIDAVLSNVSDRPLDKINPRDVLNVLRLGAVQILLMDVGDHAAVDTSVELLNALGHQKQKGFANALLRTIVRKKDSNISMLTDKVQANSPSWLWRELEKDYGAESAIKIAKAHLGRAPVDITVKKDAEDWAEALDGQLLDNGSIRLDKSGAVTELPGFDQGEWWVQSASAALPVQVLGDVTDKTIVDLCAAPGGKTMQLAAAGAKVTAVDISKNRLKRLEENLERCNLSAKVVKGDGKTWQPEHPVDIVLVDAPCSATGTIRHQPDVLHLKTEKDMHRLARVQKEILENASHMVKSGGVLMYCTCSLQFEESERVVEAFLSQSSDFSLSSFTSDDVFGWDEMLDKSGMIRILPFHLQETGGMDGFFIARLIRS